MDYNLYYLIYFRMLSSEEIREDMTRAALFASNPGLFMRHDPHEERLRHARITSGHRALFERGENY